MNTTIDYDPVAEAERHADYVQSLPLCPLCCEMAVYPGDTLCQYCRDMQPVLDRDDIPDAEF